MKKHYIGERKLIFFPKVPTDCMCAKSEGLLAPTHLDYTSGRDWMLVSSQTVTQVDWINSQRAATTMEVLYVKNNNARL